jgi:3-oxoacid CoA-transferase subunit B
MDLVASARRVIVTMEHTSPKILKQCSLPLTGFAVVESIVTELGFMRITPEGIVLEEIAPGLTVEEVQAVTEARLIPSPALRSIDLTSRPRS